MFKNLQYVSEFVASDTEINNRVNRLYNFMDESGNLNENTKRSLELQHQINDRIHYYKNKFIDDPNLKNLHVHVGKKFKCASLSSNPVLNEANNPHDKTGTQNIAIDVYEQAIPLQGIFMQNDEIIFKALSPILNSKTNDKSVGIIAAFTTLGLLVENYHNNDSLDIDYAVILYKNFKTLNTSKIHEVELFSDVLKAKTKFDPTIKIDTIDKDEDKNINNVINTNSASYVYSYRYIYEQNNDLYSDTPPIGVHLVWKNITHDLALYNKRNLKNIGQLSTILLLSLFLIHFTIKISERYLQKIIAEQTESLSQEIQIRKKREEELELKSKESHLNAKFASIGEMAAGMAHEINNPLTIINGNLDRAKKALEQNDLEKAFSAISKGKKGVVRITRIIALLKGYARDGRKDEFKDSSLESIIIDSMELTQDSIRKRDIGFEGPKEIPQTTIFCQNIQIVQVIVNLLNNARDAVEGTTGPWVKMTLTQNESKVIIKIIDSGKGIPDKIAEHMFIPFFTTKEIGKGTGLGLGLSKEIITTHHGRLYIDSEAPNTTFVIELFKKDPARNCDKQYQPYKVAS